MITKASGRNSSTWEAILNTEATAEGLGEWSHLYDPSYTKRGLGKPSELQKVTHYYSEIIGSSDPHACASQQTGTTGPGHHAQL